MKDNRFKWPQKLECNNFPSTTPNQIEEISTNSKLTIIPSFFLSFFFQHTFGKSNRVITTTG